MLAALIAGQRDPHALADLARKTMRAKTGVLRQALTGQFTDHHAFLLAMMLDRVDALTAQIHALTTRIEEAIAPHAAQVAQLDEIPGIGATAAQEIIAEIGADMTRFPTPGHLASWAKFAPRARQSAGRSKAATTGKGNPWLGGTIGEAATGAARTSTFLAARYKRVVKRRGKKTRPRRRRQLHPGHLLAPALRPRRTLHRPRPRLARPPRTPTAQTPAHRRTRTPLRQESHPQRRRLTPDTPDPANPTRLRCRSAGRCRLPADRPIFDSASECQSAIWSLQHSWRGSPPRPSLSGVRTYNYASAR